MIKGQKTRGFHKVDDRDLRILQVLVSEGRISNSELSKRVNLSEAPCWKRVRRLEDLGIIRGYRAELSLSRVMEYAEFFVTVNLDRQAANVESKFESYVAEIDEIAGCWSIGGDIDYLLHCVALDVKRYQTVIDAMLAEDLELVSYFTYLVLKPVKVTQNAAFPLLKDYDTG